MNGKKKNRVLAIDDEPAMIEWLKILLEHEGYEVRTAMIGTRGEEIFKTWKPDVVVTDMLLPDIDGLELLRKFKQTHGDTEVIVVKFDTATCRACPVRDQCTTAARGGRQLTLRPQELHQALARARAQQTAQT